MAWPISVTDMTKAWQNEEQKGFFIVWLYLLHESWTLIEIGYPHTVWKLVSVFGGHVATLWLQRAITVSSAVDVNWQRIHFSARTHSRVLGRLYGTRCGQRKRHLDYRSISYAIVKFWFVSVPVRTMQFSPNLPAIESLGPQMPLPSWNTFSLS